MNLDTALRPVLAPERRDLFALLLLGPLLGLAVVTLGTEHGRESFSIIPALAVLAMTHAVWRHDRAPISPADAAVATGLAVLAALPSQQAVWLVIILAGIWLAWRCPALRREMVVLVAAAVIVPATHYSLRAFGTPLLSTDAWLTASLLQWTTGTGSHEGNIVHGPADHSLVVLYGCSSFQNLGGACLAWWAATTWLGVRVGRSAVWIMAGVGIAVLGINVVRLYLMALDRGWYEFWHNGDGVGIYDLAATAIPLIAVALTVRHASRA